MKKLILVFAFFCFASLAFATTSLDSSLPQNSANSIAKDKILLNPHLLKIESELLEIYDSRSNNHSKNLLIESNCVASFMAENTDGSSTIYFFSVPTCEEAWGKVAAFLMPSLS